ncbi:hypothetical protein [Microlunatus parietis]|uniref:DUF4878 domain-containing protein n=1 Tax=Microlunatus parietis TaxID=682979 RepID=A0A7Y9I474_9ACTN|nr:hypothetical protein [Microlunatus parietis]NYE69867.1 hypothetical protein [Microlunatus parietis]
MTDSGPSETAAPGNGQRGPDFVAPGLPDGTAPPAVQPVPYHGQLGPYLGGTNPPAPNQPPIPYGPVPGEPGPPPDRPKRPLRLLWIPIVAAVAVLAIVVAVAALTRQPQPPATQAPMPEDTARAFVDAGYRSDCDAARRTIDQEFWDRAGLTCLDVSFHGSEFIDTTIADWAFTDTEVTGDLASITLDPPGEIPPTVLRMRLIDGAWRITDWQF